MLIILIKLIKGKNDEYHYTCKNITKFIKN